MTSCKQVLSYLVLPEATGLKSDLNFLLSTLALATASVPLVGNFVKYPMHGKQIIAEAQSRATALGSFWDNVETVIEITNTLNDIDVKAKAEDVIPQFVEILTKFTGGSLGQKDFLLAFAQSCPQAEHHFLTACATACLRILRGLMTKFVSSLTKMVSDASAEWTQVCSQLTKGTSVKRNYYYVSLFCLFHPTTENDKGGT